MGISSSKTSSNLEHLHIVTYNANNSNSMYNSNIIYNFVNSFENKKSIICIQGLDKRVIDDTDNKFFEFYIINFWHCIFCK